MKARKNFEIYLRDMAGMRDRLIHGYGEVNLWRVWETVQKDLPNLQANIKAILTQEIEQGKEEQDGE